MTERLFDETDRTYSGPADCTESDFEYLNRSNRSHVRDERSILEGWFEEFETWNPDAMKDVRSRFRSVRNDHHLGALTELFLHHLLLMNGLVPEAHPDLPAVTTTPDFLARRDSEPRLMAEAVMVYEDKPVARRRMFRADIIDAINSVRSPDFFVDVNYMSRDPHVQPKLSKIKESVQNKIDDLSYHEVRQQYEDSKKLPEWFYTQDMWRLKFTARPVSEAGREIRDASSRVLGLQQLGVTAVTVDEAIRDNLLKKAKKYGKLEMPFIVVVNVHHDWMACEDETIADALFGKEVYDYVAFEDGSHETIARRESNGVWIIPRAESKNSHLSGVLVVPGLDASRLTESTPVLWHNPYAAFPLGMDELNVEQRYVDMESGDLKKYNVT